jgi:hypothetical protein
VSAEVYAHERKQNNYALRPFLSYMIENLEAQVSSFFQQQAKKGDFGQLTAYALLPQRRE